MDSYGIADWLGYLIHAEVDFLKRLARSLPNNPVVVNIGAGGGTSGMSFLESRPDLILHTIDIQGESSPLGCLEGERVMVEASGMNWEGRFFQICGDSKEVDWKGEADMVFIDGDHTYKGCSGDIKAWLPRIKEGGIMSLHDYKTLPPRIQHDGVNRAVDDLLVGEYEMLEKVDSIVAFKVS